MTSLAGNALESRNRHTRGAEREARCFLITSTRRGSGKMSMRIKTRTISCAVIFTLSSMMALGSGKHAAKAETVLVSANGAGTGSGNGFSFAPAISADGRLVAFESVAGDLVDNDTNGDIDVFVRDLKTDTTTLVSVNYAGTNSGNSQSRFPVFSADGRSVAFDSLAGDLVAND